MLAACLIVAAFSCGAIAGLLLGPATERIESAYTQGFLSGYEQGSKDSARDPR